MSVRPPSTSLPQSLRLQNLRQTATWIRDRLDPVIAREGPDFMHPDDVLVLHDLFKDLQTHDLDVDTIAASRIHSAIREICGKATRWPHKLANECDKIVDSWERRHGPLQEIRAPLYNNGGRLFKVCTVADLTRKSLLTRWTRQSRLLVDDSRAYTHWQDEIEPGQWWINGMLAFRDGIIDSNSTDGGICADDQNAYAILLKDTDEVEGSSESGFTYRCPPNDRGRYRLTAAHFRARYPVRILRSHSLISLWAPKVGVRYDGLYRVTGWSIKPRVMDGRSELDYLVTFVREPGQASMDSVLLSPTSEDIDDYKEYKRLRRLQRELLRQQATARLTGNLAPSIDEVERNLTKSLAAQSQQMAEGGALPLPSEVQPQTTAPRTNVSSGPSVPDGPKSRIDSTFTAPRNVQFEQKPPSLGMGDPVLMRSGHTIEHRPPDAAPAGEPSGPNKPQTRGSNPKSNQSSARAAGLEATETGTSSFDGAIDSYSSTVWKTVDGAQSLFQQHPSVMASQQAPWTNEPTDHGDATSKTQSPSLALRPHVARLISVTERLVGDSSAIPPTFHIPDWTGPSRWGHTRALSNGTDVCPCSPLPSACAGTQQAVDHATRVRSQFQIMEHDVGLFSGASSTRRFLVALMRSWHHLAEAEYPDCVVPSVDNVEEATRGLQDEFESSQELDFVDVFAHSTCPKSVWDKDHDCSRCCRVGRPQGAWALAERVKADAAAREASGSSSDTVTDPPTG